MANWKNIANMTLNMIICLAKAFFNALISVSWGIATFFILAAVITYYKLDPSSVTLLLELAQTVMKYWGVFFLVFLGYDFVTSYKDFARNLNDIEESRMEKTK